MKFRLFRVSILLILLTGCEKKDELIIDEVEDPKIQERVVVEDEGNKPLIVISKDDEIEILVRSDGAPGMYLGDDGEVHGFYVDLEKIIMKEMNQKYHFLPYDDIGPVYQGIKSGLYHMALAVPDVPDYRERVNLSDAFEILHYVTFVQEDNLTIKGNNRDEIIKSLYGKKVGVQAHGHIYQALREYKEIKLVEYPTTTKALEALNKGILDAVPDVKRIGLYYKKINSWKIKYVGDPIIDHRITTGFSTALDPSLMDRYNRALKKIVDNGQLKSLWESYYGEMRDEDIPN